MGWPVFDGIMDDEGVVVLLVVFEGGGVEVFVVNGVNVFGGGWGVLAEWAWGGSGGGGGGGGADVGEKKEESGEHFRRDPRDEVGNSDR